MIVSAFMASDTCDLKLNFTSFTHLEATNGMQQRDSNQDLYAASLKL